MTAGTWIASVDGRRLGSAASRRAAMNLCDRPWQRGACTVTHATSGEAWARRRGSWFVSGTKGKEKS